MSRTYRTLVFTAWVLITGSTVLAQDLIVLRDLTLIRDRSVTDFEDQAVTLDDNRELEWDQILSATVSPERQSEFDQNLNSIGLPLFRLKSRVRIKDWVGAGDVSAPLYRILLETESGEAGPFSKPDVAYLIYVTTMKSYIHRRQYAQAVLPFLQAARLQKRNTTNVEDDSNSAGDLKFDLLPAADVQRMMSSEIMPIWFDAVDSRDGFKLLSQSLVGNQEEQASGSDVYLASLAIHHHRFEMATELIERLKQQDASWKTWGYLLGAQLHIAQGDFKKADESLRQSASQREPEQPGIRAIRWYLQSARYFVPDERLASTNYDSIKLPTEDELTAAMLQLLKIPAHVGDRYPALSAADSGEVRPAPTPDIADPPEPPPSVLRMLFGGNVRGHVIVGLILLLSVISVYFIIAGNKMTIQEMTTALKSQLEKMDNDPDRIKIQLRCDRVCECQHVSRLFERLSQLGFTQVRSAVTK